MCSCRCHSWALSSVKFRQKDRKKVLMKCGTFPDSTFLLALISIVFHHYKELKECIAEGKHVENKVYTNNKELTMKKEEELYNFIIMINETTADHNLLTHPLHIPLSTIPHVHTERRINFL